MKCGISRGRRILKFQSWFNAFGDNQTENVKSLPEPNTLHPLKASLKSSVPLLRLETESFFRQMFFTFNTIRPSPLRDMMYVVNCETE